MADMADPEDVYACWDELTEAGITGDRAGHVHELGGGAEGVLRQERRHRLHVVERAEGVRLGARARREGAVLPRPAPGPQHRPQEGHLARRDGRLGLHAALRLARREHARAAGAGEGDPLARLVLGAPAVHGRADREGARGAPGREGDRPPGVHDGSRAGGGHGRLDRVHHDARSRRRRRARRGPSAPRSTSCRGWRGRTRTRRCSAWTRSSAPARRCTASTRRTWRGRWTSWRRAAS